MWILAAFLLLAAVFNLCSGQEYQNITYGHGKYFTLFAGSAYCPPDEIANWTCLHCLNPGFHVTLQFAGDYDITGYLGYDSNTNLILVVFRGSSNINNWLADLYILKSDYPYPNVPAAYVHSGFWEAWMSLEETVMNETIRLLALYPDYEVFFVGHSLGGAIATLGVLRTNEFLIAPASLYTFGQPRVGNQVFADYLYEVVSTTWRSVHYNDIVPHLPPTYLDFWHIPMEVWLPAWQSTTYVICDAPPLGEDPNCSDSIWFPLSVEAHDWYYTELMGCPWPVPTTDTSWWPQRQQKQDKQKQEKLSMLRMKEEQEEEEAEEEEEEPEPKLKALRIPPDWPITRGSFDPVSLRSRQAAADRRLRQLAGLD